MHKKDLVILTENNRFFGQTRKPWVGLNIEKVAGILSQSGFNVSIYNYHEVVNGSINIEGKTIIYSFSQRDNYRQYIGDIVYSLSRNNRIIPGFDLFKCHENKGYQELYKKQLGLNGLNAMYFTSLKEIKEGNIKFPAVLKKVKGSNGKGVYLVNNCDELRNIVNKFKSPFDIFTRIDLLRRKYIRKKKFKEYPDHSDKKDFNGYKKYITREENFIIQELVPGLDHDYRVLIAGSRYYVMKRLAKSGDFRASGSKKFVFDEEPNPQLLNHAQQIYEKFDTPFLSIDLIFDGKQYYMIEFQSLHFGVNVVVKSKGYFSIHPGGAWCLYKEKPMLERLFAQTFAEYLSRQNDQQ